MGCARDRNVHRAGNTPIRTPQFTTYTPRVLLHIRPPKKGLASEYAQPEGTSFLVTVTQSHVFSGRSHKFKAQ